MAPLFMDDTTLVAQSRQDLELMTGAYVRYCFKFHMRLNASKSKLMRFTRADDADEFSFTVGAMQFSTPEKAPGQSRCRIKYLGVTLDSALTTDAHVAAKLGSAQARCSALDIIRQAMGPSFALWYLRVHLAPSVLFGLEVCPLSQGKRARLAQLHTQLIAEAVGLGALGGNPGRCSEGGCDIPCIRREFLVSETGELPWDLEVSRRAIRLLAGLNMAATGRSTTLTKVVYARGGGLRFRGPADATRRAWRVPALPSAHTSGVALQRWKAGLRLRGQRVASTPFV